MVDVTAGFPGRLHIHTGKGILGAARSSRAWSFLPDVSLVQDDEVMALVAVTVATTGPLEELVDNNDECSPTSLCYIVSYVVYLKWILLARNA